jgi:hypothetical protein
VYLTRADQDSLDQPTYILSGGLESLPWMELETTLAGTESGSERLADRETGCRNNTAKAAPIEA